MNKIFIILIALVIGFSISSCNGNENSEKKTDTQNTEHNIGENTILVYYFHGSIRCHTCVSVDEDTHKYLKEMFSDKINNGKIIFKSINIDENEKPDLIKKYEIYGQTLLFIKGDKVINKTDEAFQYVTTKPEKWEQIVETTITELIK